MSTHAAQNKIHTNKKTQTKFEIWLDFLCVRLMVIVHDARNLMFIINQCFPTEKMYVFTTSASLSKHCYRRDMEINAGCYTYCVKLYVVGRKCCIRFRRIPSISKSLFFSLRIGIENIFMSFSVL